MNSIVMFFINNMDMIKISHVMTIYTIKSFLCMCITSLYTYTFSRYKNEMYNEKYFIYVLQAK